MAKHLAKATNACNAKTISKGSDFNTPWVIYNPDSSNFKVLYSTNGNLEATNYFYGGGSGSGAGTNEFASCGSNSGN